MVENTSEFNDCVMFYFYICISDYDLIIKILSVLSLQGISNDIVTHGVCVLKWCP